MNLQTKIVWHRIEAVFDRPWLDWAPVIEIFRAHGIDSTEELPNSIAGYTYDENIIEPLKEDLNKLKPTQIEINQIDQEDWSEAWKQYFQPRQIGPKLWIYPSWNDDPLPNDLLCIQLDPGQAFGTGDHPTTRMCLELMQTIELQNKSFADIGCGSGILSVAACLLQASSVHAVDNDPLSIESANLNAQRNHVQYNIHLGMGFSPLDQNLTFDVICSNIISAAIINITPDTKKFLKPGGYWIVSGIIQDNWTLVLETLQKHGFKLIKKQEEGEWVAALLCH